MNTADDIHDALGDWVFRIPVDFVPDLQKRFDALAKRADKIGVPAPTFVVDEIVDEPERVPAEDQDGPGVKLVETGRIIQIALVRVFGESPKYDGWSLLAVIDRDLEEPTAPNVIDFVPGLTADIDSVQAWRANRGECEHCKVTRVRKSLVVCEHEDGRRVVVGKTCLRDFLGHRSPEAIASWVETLATLGDLLRSYGSYDPNAIEHRYDSAYFLARVVATIRKIGWVSKGQAREDEHKTPTVKVVLYDIDHANKKGRDSGVTVHPQDITDDDYFWSAQALEWALTCDNGRGSDYLLNVESVAAKSGWRFRDLGLGASIASAFRREVERAAETYARGARFANSVHFGEIGKRQNFDGVVLYEPRTLEGDFGISYLVTIATDDGNQVKWFASTTDIPPIGVHCTFTATPKRHTEYNGTAQTQVSRLKWVATATNGTCPVTDDGEHDVHNSYGDPLEPANAKQRKTNTVTCRRCHNNAPASDDKAAWWYAEREERRARRAAVRNDAHDETLRLLTEAGTPELHDETKCRWCTDEAYRTGTDIGYDN